MKLFLSMVSASLVMPALQKPMPRMADRARAHGASDVGDSGSFQVHASFGPTNPHNAPAIERSGTGLTFA